MKKNIIFNVLSSVFFFASFIFLFFDIILLSNGTTISYINIALGSKNMGITPDLFSIITLSVFLIALGLNLLILGLSFFNNAFKTTSFFKKLYCVLIVISILCTYISLYVYANSGLTAEIRIYFILIPILLIFSFVFYILSSITKDYC